MPPVRRSELLPVVDQLVALVEKSDTPEMTLRDAVELLTNRVPIIVEAHVVRSADHAGGIERLGRALLSHVQAGRASRLAGMRRAVLRAARAHLGALGETVKVEGWLDEMERLR